MNNSLNKELDKLQEGKDYSFPFAQMRGKELTPAQKKAKEDMVGTLKDIETPLIDEEISALLNK